MESIAKAGADKTATGTAAAALFTKAALVTEEKGEKDFVRDRFSRQMDYQYQRFEPNRLWGSPQSYLNKNPRATDFGREKY